MVKKRVVRVLTSDQIEAKLAIAKEEGYRYAAVIGDTLCTVHPQATTFALMVGVNPDDMGSGYERRYCYETAQDAIEALNTYTDVDEHPPGPWIKCKGIYQGHAVDLLNPALFQPCPNGTGEYIRATPRTAAPVSLDDIIRGRTAHELETFLNRKVA